MAANGPRETFRWAPVARLARVVRGAPGNILATAVAGIVMVAIVVAIAVIAYHASLVERSGSPASGYGTATPQPTIVLRCGTDTTPDCPTAQSGSDWIPISSDTPAAVQASCGHSSLAQAVQASNATGRGDAQYDISRPETPVFVHILQQPGNGDVPDNVWVIPYDTADGRIGVVMTCAINSSHTAVEPQGISGSAWLAPHGQLARMTMSAATQAIQTQSHIAMRVGAQPYLVCISIDATKLETGQIVWNAGGLWPGDPLWLVPGADGQDRIYGDDGKIYLASQIPS